MPKYAPHTRTSALALAKAKVGKRNVVGMCAHEVIVNILGIPGPWKWGGNGRAFAINYFLGAQKVVRTSDPAKIPAGAVVIWGPRPHASTVGGQAGHIAIGAGGGYCYSTDLPRTGYWGKVKITDVIRLWSKPLVGYVLVDGMGYTLTDPPAAPAYAKPAAGEPWFRLATYNAKSATLTSGSRAWSKRRFSMVATIDSLHADVLCMQEVAKGQQLDDLTRDLKPALHLVPGGGKWRQIWRSDRVKVIDSGLVELAPLLAGDTKQMAWLAGIVDDAPFLVGGFHLEEADGAKADAVRPRQLVNADDHLAVIAVRIEKDHDIRIGGANRFLCGDTNSRGLVAAKAATLGMVPATTNAQKVYNATWATFTNWVKNVRGLPIDYIFVDKSRPVIATNQRVNVKASDHNSIVAVIARKK